MGLLDTMDIWSELMMNECLDHRRASSLRPFSVCVYLMVWCFFCFVVSAKITKVEVRVGGLVCN